MSSLQEIRLPPAAIVSLFKDQLVVLQDSSEPAMEKGEIADEKSDVEVWGGNIRRVLILTSHESLDELSTMERTFLDKMLTSCKMNLDDVKVVPFARKKPDAETLKRLYDPRQMILFGITAADIALPLRFPEFKLQSFDQTTYLQIPAMASFMSNSEESRSIKVKLWACLRTMFQLP